jgi:hypothetical protein
MAEVFERIERGTLKRVIINLPLRHTKFEFTFVSDLFPSGMVYSSGMVYAPLGRRWV